MVFILIQNSTGTIICSIKQEFSVPVSVQIEII